MVQFLDIMPVLRVADMQRSLDWYTGVLGFQIASRFVGDGDGENCFLRAGTKVLMLSTGSHLGGVPTFTGTLHFRIVGVDELYARVQGRDGIVWPLERQEYGTREFGIRDPDGYILAFAETNDA